MRINSDFLHEHALTNLNMGGIAGIKDLQGKIVAATPSLAHLLGFSDADALIKIPLFEEEIPCKAAKLSQHFSNEDKTAIGDTEGVKTLNWCYYANNKPSLLLNEKNALKNNDDETIGYMIRCMDLTRSNIINLSAVAPKLHKHQIINGQFSVMLLDENIPLKISKRQMLCLYYLLRGYTYPQIASTLCVANRTVETHVDTLKNKFYCDTKQQLIEKAISKGFLSIIPESILLM
ncbi:helix-turn-helix transcriptional regulator [Legionella shakespearei]|uniref:Transcriptional regulator LuxR n=1 Tax=Legionella shakespearei DSM 23087 TaxID=1122169 RepID=A0A0W0YQ72_9GAMM|nr:helix-turn-helix transcriptional regulator [Legionella shakespearei]KTD59052.1 transcriptional regulator LuxR [Legionella shakespearei DSM 23087]